MHIATLSCEHHETSSILPKGRRITKDTEYVRMKRSFYQVFVKQFFLRNAVRCRAKLLSPGFKDLMINTVAINAVLENDRLDSTVVMQIIYIPNIAIRFSVVIFIYLCEHKEQRNAGRWDG